MVSQWSRRRKHRRSHFQEEIGLLSGVSRQRTNEALHELERAGLLRVEFGGATVLDLNGLRAYSGAPAGSSARAA